MERKFALPLALAAAIHVGLLFGIPNSTTATTTRAGDKPPVAPPAPDSDPMEVILAPPGDEALPSAAANDHPPPPVTPERPPTPSADPFVIVVPERPVRNPDRVATDLTNVNFGPESRDGQKVDGGRVGNILTPDLLDNPPRTRLQVPPQYPPDKRRTGEEGDVVVEFTVDEAGAVVGPRVVRSTDRAFDEPTLRALARWRFEPGTRDGRVVRFRMAVPIVFKLDRE